MSHRAFGAYTRPRHHFTGTCRSSQKSSRLSNTWHLDVYMSYICHMSYVIYIYIYAIYVILLSDLCKIQYLVFTKELDLICHMLCHMSVQQKCSCSIVLQGRGMIRQTLDRGVAIDSTQTVDGTAIYAYIDHSNRPNVGKYMPVPWRVWATSSW